MRNAMATVLCALGICASVAEAGTVIGKARTLDDKPIVGLQVTVFSSNGNRILSGPTPFSDGEYNFNITSTNAQDLGVIVRFDAPNRLSTQVTLMTNVNHTFNVALPVDDRCFCCWHSSCRSRWFSTRRCR